MGQDVKSLHFRSPYAPVQPVAVFGDRGQVDYAEIRAVVRHDVVRCGLAEVIKSGPHELTYLPILVFRHREINVRKIGPAAVFEIVG